MSKKVQQRILNVIKRMAYRPSRAERVVYADVILQQMTAMQAWEKHLMAVIIRNEAPGFLLLYKADGVKKLSDGQLATVLAHECQHIRKGDGAKIKTYEGKKVGEWDAPTLFNVARDCQINDELFRLGFDKVEGMSGEATLGRNTEADDIDALMAELAEKLDPPPPPESGDDAGDGQVDLQGTELAEGEEGKPVEVDVGKMAGNEPTKGPARVKGSLEQARWDNFLATVLDTRNSEDRWHRQPKRLAGVEMYTSYQATLPRRQPLPRKTALMAIDVSGSMDETGVQRICALIRNAPSNYNLTVVCFDTGIDEWKDFRTNEEMPRRGGGTNFAMVKQFALNMGQYPDAILCITDGGGTVPEVKRPANWTWIIYGADADEFGQMAKMRSVDLDKIVVR